MRGDDARKVCPDINLIQVPTHFGKADLTDYRDAGSEVRTGLTDQDAVRLQSGCALKTESRVGPSLICSARFIDFFTFIFIFP